MDNESAPSSSGGLPLSVEGGLPYIYGDPVFQGDMDELLKEIDSRIHEGGRHLVVTANVDHLMNLEASSAFRGIYHRASLRLLDGMPLVRLARRLGGRRVHRLTGADLLARSAAWSADHGMDVALVGGAEGVAATAAERLSRESPGSRMHSIDSPFLEDVSDEASTSVIRRLHDVQPRLVFLCFGSPKQESWYAHWEHRLPDAVYVGAGAAVDFAAGKRTRAPSWVQSAGLEWAWRVAQEPARLARRYFLKGPGYLRLRAESIRGSRS